MKKIRKRIFAVALAAVMLFNIPETASYAEQAAADMETLEMETSAAAEPEEDDSGELMPETAANEEKEPETDGENPEEKNTPSGEDEKTCDCGILCTEDSINGDCPVCGAEGADLSDCEGTAFTGRRNEEEDTEDTESEATESEDTNLCAHHKEHTEDCGFVPATEDGEESPCAYECCICPIEELIAALPKVTEDNGAEVRAQLDKILDIYWELTEEEQEQVDISRCMELQEELDAANIPVPVEGEVSVGYQKAEWNGNEVVYSNETADCILVTDSAEAVTWDAGWYMADGTVTISQPITVNGAVNLILADGCTLNVEQGIVVTENNSLTIYAQAGGTGTLNATGVYDNYKASAGIGGSTGSPNSGAITIHGGEIHATGGGQSGMDSAAGIGGGAVYDGEGGNSGEITIYGGTVTADCGQGNVAGAGIGGGASALGSGGTGSNITIYGGTVTAASHSDVGGAGIGGGAGGGGNGGAGSNIQIYDGAVNATGGTYGAGIGGGSGVLYETSGAGSNITISGGIVTAVGGKYAAGIGGGGGYIGGYNNTANITGGTGTSISITGGIVDAQGGAGNASGLYAGESIGCGGNAQGTASVTKTAGIVFENGEGFVYGDVTFTGTYAVPAAYTLTISTGSSLSGSGTLTGGSAYLIEGLSADMISVPEGWHYTKDDMSEDIKEQVGLNGDITICGQTFKADTDGWELSVTKEFDLKYIVKYTHTDGTVVSKDVILTQAQTTLSGVAVYKADGTTPANTFGADETFIVKATPEILANAIMKAAAFTTPSEKQMALFVGDAQVSEPVGAGVDGVYTMTVKASDVLELGNVKPNGDLITLTVKFVGNGNMADAAGTVAVNITAEAEVNGTLYPTLKKVFEDVKSGTLTGDVAITLLRDIDLTGQLSVGRSSVNVSTPEIRITLELNGKTISAPETALYVSDSKMILTIQDSSAGKTGSIRGGSSNSYTGTGVYLDVGTLSLTGGNFLGNLYGVHLNKNNFSPPTLEVSGDAVIQGTGQDSYGLNVSSTLGSVNIRLSGGTFTGGHGAISADNGNTLKNLLAEGQGDVCYAYFDGDTPTTKDLNASFSSYKPITVKPCTHIGEGICEYQSSADALTHSKTCLACGMVWDAEDCKYTFEGHTGTCGNCRSTITLFLQNADNLTYDGSAKEPTVTVRRGETALDASKYIVSYSNNKDAGTNTASVAVTIGSGQGTYTKTFSIGRATPAITWNSTSQTVNYTGSAAEITAPMVALVNGETYNGEIRYSYTGTSSGTGLPTDTGTYTIKASIAEQGNYTAAETANTMTLTIDRAEGKLTVPENSVSKTFGDREFSLNCSTNGDGKITYVSSNRDVATVSVDGNVLITGVGETVITAILAEGTNHTGGARQEITVTVKKASAPIIMGETRNYTYTNGSNGAAIIDVAGKLPKDRGKTEYTVTTTDEKGILSNVTVDNDGNLRYTVLGNKSEGDTASITVTAKMANYETAAFTVDIELVKKKAVEPQVGSSVSVKGSNILTYGQTLSDLTLDSVIFVEQGTNTEVKGILAWKAPSDVPVVATGMAEWVFTPEDSNEYVELTGMVAITVVKATPKVEAPTADAVTYSPWVTLDHVGLTGGSATWIKGGNTVTVEGIWSWKDVSDIPSVGNSGYTVVFTPKDTTNYNTVECTMAVPVAKAAPHIAVPPTAAQITYGDALNASALTGGTAQYSGSDNTAVAGSFAWKDGTIKPAVSDSGSTEYTVVFTPVDGMNYSSVETKITLTVEQAENVPDMPPTAMNVARKCEKVSDVELPEGWKWQDADKDIALEIGVPVTATAVYVGADKDNYKNVAVAVVITRLNCDHKNTELRNVAVATCQKKGYSGDTYCLDCGELLTKGAETELADHSGGTATCINGKICVVCGAEYSGKNSGNHTHTEIHGAIEATCTADGYTGDTYCTDCNVKISSGTVIHATGHDWHITSEEAATTTSKGRRVYTCSKCRQTREESIPKLPRPSHTHNYSARETKAATCTENGIITYSCSCGDSYMQNTAALGHNYRSEVTKQPTRSEVGIRTYTCTRCGSTYMESIPKLLEDAHTHNYKGSVTKKATCTETGIRTYICACGDSYTRTIPAQGHNYINEVTTEPTMEKAGVRTYTCTRCGNSYTESIPKLPSENHKHDYNVTVVKEAACAEAGVKRYACACKDSYTESIPALGHRYISKVIQEPTVSAEGVMAYTCTRCGDSYTKPIGKLADTSSESENRPESGKPFIKDESSKEGWTVIKEETDHAGEGNTITVDMNGSTVMPGDVLENIRGRDVTVVFDMGNGITWSVNGKSVQDGEISNIDFSVETGTEMIPADIINKLTGERYYLQLSLAHEGEFGFTTVLSINLGKENAGLTASLYYYNEISEELEFISSGEVAEDGMASLAFTHTSDYVIVVGEEENGEDVSVSVPSETPESESTEDSGTSLKTDPLWRPWWFVVIGVVVVIIGIGMFSVVKKRREDERGGGSR